MIDVDAYFARIGYSGPREVSLDVLKAIHAKHSEAIAFENLNPLLGWPVALDPTSLERKLVREGRGGWCFEQNELFRLVLDALGFQVSQLGARVLWGAPEGTMGPRSHKALLLEFGGVRYLADVGFGGLTLPSPLRLEAGIEQATSHELFRLAAAGSDFILEALVAGEWKPLYRFGLEAQYARDYEVASWYLCHHPESFFHKSLLAARVAPGVRYALRDTDLSIHRVGEPSEKRSLRSPEELRAVLENEFRLRLPDSPDLDAALQRLVA